MVPNVVLSRLGRYTSGLPKSSVVLLLEWIEILYESNNHSGLVVLQIIPFIFSGESW